MLLRLPTTATLFRREEVNAYGELSYGRGILIRCRWENRTELIRTEDHREAVSKAIAYLSAPVDLGDKIALGGHYNRLPAAVKGVWEVLAIKESPRLRGYGDGLWKVWL